MRTIAQLNEDKKLADFMDDHYLVGNTYTLTDGTKYVDPGDALQRTGYIGVAEALSADSKPEFETARDRFKVRLCAHRIGPGLYVRHRYSDHWARSLRVTSGDQMRPTIIAMGLFNMRTEVREVVWQLLCNLGFYWNTRDTGAEDIGTNKWADPVMPDHWSMYLRALGPIACTLFLPLLLLGDLWSVFGTLWATFVYPYQRLQNCDQLNRIAMLTQGVVAYPTPLSRLAHYIFKTWRPKYRLFGQTLAIATRVHWVRYWQPYDLTHPQNVVDYINESYFWAPADPPLHKIWYKVSKKYWENT